MFNVQRKHKTPFEPLRLKQITTAFLWFFFSLFGIYRIVEWNILDFLFRFLSPITHEHFNCSKSNRKWLNEYDDSRGSALEFTFCLFVISEWQRWQQQHDMHMRMIHALFAWPQYVLICRWFACCRLNSDTMWREEITIINRRAEWKRKWRRSDRFCFCSNEKTSQEEWCERLRRADLCCFQATESTKRKWIQTIWQLDPCNDE